LTILDANCERAVESGDATDSHALYELGRRAREEGRDDEAVALFTRSLALNPEFSRVWHGLGLIARERGARTEALAHFREAFAREPENAWIGHDFGHELREAGQLEEAEAVYRGLVDKMPDFARWRQALGQILRQRGARAEALDLFRAAWSLDAENIWIGHDYGHELREAGRIDEAEAVYRAVIAKQPDFSRGWQALGQMAAARGAHEEALGHFRRALACDPGNVWIANALGQALREAGRLDEAEKAFRDIVASAPDFARAWQALGQIASQRGAWDEALAHARAAAALEPDNIWIGQDLGRALRENGRLDEAESVFRGLVAQKPDFSRGWQALGQIARQRGDWEAALAHLRQALASEPDNVWIANELGQSLRESGQLDDAEAIFRALIAQKPDFARAWQALGQIVRQRGDWEEALAHFRAARAGEPDNVWIGLDLAYALRETGRLDDAEEVFRALIAHKPDLARAWQALGQIARQRRAPEPALEHFRAAHAAEPDNVWMAQDVAFTLRDLGRRDEAEDFARAFAEAHENLGLAWTVVADLSRGHASDEDIAALHRRAVQAEPDCVHARRALANHLASKGKLAAAAEQFDAILALDGAHVAALIGKGQIAARMGQGDLARDCFSRAAAAPGAPVQALVELARLDFEAGRLEESERRLRQAIARQPGSAYLHMRLGANARALGDFAAAEAAFAAAAQADPSVVQAATERAMCEFSRGDAASALERVRRAIADFPRHPAPLETMAFFAQVFDDFATAVDLRLRALALDAGNPGSHIALAFCLIRLGRIADAEQVLARGERNFGATPALAMSRADIARDRGEPTVALKILDAAQAHFPDEFEIPSRRIGLLIALGRFVEAESELAARDSLNARERARLAGWRGLLALARWRPREARGCFDEALALDGGDAGLNEQAARAAMLLPDVALAQRHLRASAQRNVGHRLRNRGEGRATQTMTGQILDEFRLDCGLLEQIAAANLGPDAAQRLAALARDNPDHTPTALLFVVALRRARRFAKPRFGAGAARGAIPANIAQFWDQSLPADVAVYCDSWRSLNPDCAYRLFSSAEAREFLRRHDMTRVLGAYDRAWEPAMKADLFRLAFLYACGGYWADADDRCVAPLSHLDSAPYDLILSQEDIGSIGNNFLAAAPRHPLIAAALAAATEAIENGDSDMVWLSTGPGLITRSAAFYFADDANALGKTLVLDGFELGHFDATRCVAAYKFSRKHWTRTTFGDVPRDLLASFSPQPDAD